VAAVSRRKVLVLNHFAVPAGAPGGTRHVELFGRLEHWDATVLAGNRNLLTRGRQRDEGILKTVWVSPYASNGPSRVVNWASYALTAFVAGIRERGVDVVYASSPHLLAGVAGWALARLKRVPLIIEVRDLWPQVLVDMGQLSKSSPLFRVLKGIERFLFRQADAVVVLAEGNIAPVIADGAPAKRVTFIPNGADPDDFDVEDIPSDLRQEFGMEGLVFVYAGAHGPANGLELLLEAAGELAGSEPDVRFWLVGDGVAKGSIVATAREMELDNVVFHDPIPKQEMPRLLAAADVGLHVLADVPLFRHGVSPNKLFDYMAAGKPVLTNTPGEVARLVEQAGSGIAVPPDGLVDGVHRMAAAGPGQRARWGANGRRFMAEHRSRAALAQRVEALLNEVASDSQISERRWGSRRHR